MLEIQRPDGEGMWWRWNSQVEKALWRSMVLARCIHLLWRNEGQKWRSSHGIILLILLQWFCTWLLPCVWVCVCVCVCVCVWSDTSNTRPSCKASAVSDLLIMAETWRPLRRSLPISANNIPDPPNALVWNSFRNEDKKYRFTRNHILGQKRNWKHKEKRPLPFHVSN